jgi:hypothetical protein
MRLALRVVFGATGEVVHSTINLNSNACAPNGEVDCVTTNVVLAHNVDAFVAQAP